MAVFTDFIFRRIGALEYLTLAKIFSVCNVVDMKNALRLTPGAQLKIVIKC